MIHSFPDHARLIKQRRKEYDRHQQNDLQGSPEKSRPVCPFPERQQNRRCCCYPHKKQKNPEKAITFQNPVYVRRLFITHPTGIQIFCQIFFRHSVPHRHILRIGNLPESIIVKIILQVFLRTDQSLLHPIGRFPIQPAAGYLYRTYLPVAVKHKFHFKRITSVLPALQRFLYILLAFQKDVPLLVRNAVIRIPLQKAKFIIRIFLQDIRLGSFL